MVTRLYVHVSFDRSLISHGRSWADFQVNFIASCYSIFPGLSDTDLFTELDGTQMIAISQ